MKRMRVVGSDSGEAVAASAGEHVVARIRERILSGDYAPGSPLPQDSIAAEFDVSRIPVREALVRLRAEGLIDIEAHRGFRVRPLLAAEVDEVFRLRMALEPVAVGEGAKLAKARDHIGAREALRALSAALAASALNDIGNLNSAFHLALILPQRKPMTAEILVRLHTQSQRCVRMHLLPAGRVRRATSEHNALYEAWARGDSREASLLTAQHIEETRGELAQILA